MAENLTLTEALAYAKRGWQVLPCRPKDKRPLTAHGLKDASSDPEVIKRWWATSPNANLAIRCGMVSSGLVVIDVDGEEGRDSLKGKKLPPTAVARTGGGGWHYLYYSTKQLRPKVGILPKVDIRAEDSYIVAPPSTHPSGTLYQWLLSPEKQTITELPEWVVDLLERPEAVPPTPVPEGTPDKRKLGRAALEFVADGAPKGKQRLAAVAAARNLISAGYTVDAVAHKLWQGFQACEQDGEELWTFAEAQKIAANIAASPAPPMQPQREYTKANGRKPVIEIISAVDLMKQEFPPLRFLIPPIWPEGMSLFAAKPKIGKTWLSLGVGISLSCGGVALGRHKVEQGEVLYLALEDGKKRMQSRLQSILMDQDVPAGLHFAYSWPRVNEGGTEALAEWMQAHPKTRLIVVDTLRKIRPQERVGASSYNQDYDAIAPLTDIAHEYNVSVWGVSHLRKMAADDPMEMVSGTMGLTGAADHVLVLKRERGQHQGILYLMSRDAADQELALEWQPPHWILVGTAKEAKQSAERKQICDLIRHYGKPMSPKELADILGKNHSTVRSLVTLMNMDGVLISNGKGHYDVFPRTDYGLDENGAPIVREEQAHIIDTIDCIDTVDRANSVDRRLHDSCHAVHAVYDTQNSHISKVAKAIIKDSKAIDGEVCFCGRPLYEYNSAGEPLCDQHCAGAVAP